jgi:hypothetical protein
MQNLDYEDNINITKPKFHGPPIVLKTMYNTNPQQATC